MRVTRHATPSVDAPATYRVDYFHDGLNRRAREERYEDGVTRSSIRLWLYDGLSHQVIARAESGFPFNISQWYVTSEETDDLLQIIPGGPPSGFYEVTQPLDEAWSVHTDHQGSVRAVTDDSGAILNEYAYSAYGEDEARVETAPQPFGYTGRRYDPDTGLYYYRARDYDPATGRFLQEDPIWFQAGDLNVYRYVWNNPLNWTDPSGLTALTERRALSLVAGAALYNLSPAALAGHFARRYGLNAVGMRYFMTVGANTLRRLAAG